MPDTTTSGIKFIECQQGSESWHQARAGVITASRFADAISTVGGLDERQQKYVAAILGGADTKAACAEAGYKAAPTADCVKRAIAGENPAQPSDIARRYAADLAIERISGMPVGEPVKTWVLERGHEMETRARRAYEARTKAFVTEAGLCINGDGFGYSTDGLVNDDGLIEIKSPVDSLKVLTMWQTEDVSEYICQCMGGLWITGRKYIDLIMYVPDLASVGKDLFIKRIHRDEEFIDKMVNQLWRFQKLVDEYESIFRKPIV